MHPVLKFVQYYTQYSHYKGCKIGRQVQSRSLSVCRLRCAHVHHMKFYVQHAAIRDIIFSVLSLFLILFRTGLNQFILRAEYA